MFDLRQAELYRVLLVDVARWELNNGKPGYSGPTLGDLCRVYGGREPVR